MRILFGTILVSALAIQAAADVNVREFGAVADGKTDSTAAFQKAIDSLGGNGGEVYVPAGKYVVGDAVENADWQCAVVFRNNTVANNRARGVLFTTPKRIVCEGNFFDHVSGSAILLAGDAQGWYESGACEDLVIRKNRFRDCLTSVFQYCDALVSIHPEVKDLASQRRRYHRNILIEDNDIETFDVPLLFALSAENVTWRNNRVKRHDRYRGWGRKPFETKGCENVKVEGVDGTLLRTWQGETEV